VTETLTVPPDSSVELITVETFILTLKLLWIAATLNQALGV